MPSFEMEYSEGIALYDKAIADAEAEIIGRGLPISSRPIAMDGEFARFPRMPPDLSNVTFPELQRLIGQFTEWFGYAIGQLKLAEGSRNAGDKQRSFAWSSIRRMKTGTISDKDDAVRTDRRYMAVDAQYEHCDAKVRVYGAIAEGLKRDIETISRAASVLESRTSVEGRGVALGRKGRTDNAHASFRTGRRHPEEHPEERQTTPAPLERPPRDSGGLDVFRKRGRRR